MTYYAFLYTFKMKLKMFIFWVHWAQRNIVYFELHCLGRCDEVKLDLTDDTCCMNGMFSRCTQKLELTLKNEDFCFLLTMCWTKLWSCIHIHRSHWRDLN